MARRRPSRGGVDPRAVEWINQQVYEGLSALNAATEHLDPQRHAFEIARIRLGKYHLSRISDYLNPPVRAQIEAREDRRHMDLARARLVALAEQAELASPPPWEETCGALKHYVASDDEQLRLSAQELDPLDGHEVPAHENLLLIAAMRNALPALLAIGLEAVDLLQACDRGGCLACDGGRGKGHETECAFGDLRRAVARLRE